MEAAGCPSEVVADAVVFLEYFKDLPGERQGAKVRNPLAEVLLLCLLAVIAGAETIPTSPASAARSSICCAFFQPFREGTPPHDHLGDILATLDAEQFQRCFVAWAASLIGVPEGVVAIDGKTLRRSKGKGNAAAHIVSALPPASVWCWVRSRWRKRPTRLSPSPSCWTCWPSRARWSPPSDAMGCQRDIAQKIKTRKPLHRRPQGQSGHAA